jgi:hypothetical protein
MVGLSLFMFAVMNVTPQLISIYQERATIQEEDFAIEVCNNLIQEWIVTKAEPNFNKLNGHNGTSYTVKWSQNETMEICIDWMGANGRPKSICGEAI